MADDKSAALRPTIDHYKHGIEKLGKSAHELVSHERKVSAAHVKFSKGLGEVMHPMTCLCACLSVRPPICERHR